MVGLKLDIKNTGINGKEITRYANEVEEIHKKLHKQKDDENEFLGWLELPTNYDKKEFEKIKKMCKKNTKRFRSFSGNRNRWFIFRSKGSNRSINK